MDCMSACRALSWCKVQIHLEYGAVETDTTLGHDQTDTTERATTIRGVAPWKRTRPSDSLVVIHLRAKRGNNLKKDFYLNAKARIWP